MNGAVHVPSRSRPGGPASGGWIGAGSARAVGAERVRVGGEAARGRVVAHGVHLRAHRRHRAAAEPALHRRDEPDVGQLTGRFVQEQHAEVGRDRVVAARVHDARPGLARERVAAVDRLPDEQHLAGQVRVVRARPRARLHQGQAVRGVGPDRRDHDPRARGQRGERGRVRGVGDDQRPALRGRRQLRAGALQLVPRPAGQRDPDVRGRGARRGRRPPAPRRTRWRRAGRCRARGSCPRLHPGLRGLSPSR